MMTREGKKMMKRSGVYKTPSLTSKPKRKLEE
jgi:hypothetical protein